MDAEGTLLGLADLAVALAGFAGVVTAFQIRARPWSRFDSQRLFNMLIFAFALLFFSLLPIVWLAAAEYPWATCSALLGVTAAAQCVVSTSRAVLRPPGTQTYVAMFMAAGGLMSAIVLWLNTFGVLFQRSFTGYFIGLFWLVIASAVFFARLVYLGLSDIDQEDSGR